MKTMSTADFKAHFSSVVEELKKGNEVVITYGRKKEPLATVVPQSKMKQPNYAVKLGDLQNKASELQLIDFDMSEEELLAG